MPVNVANPIEWEPHPGGALNVPIAGPYPFPDNGQANPVPTFDAVGGSEGASDNASSNLGDLTGFDTAPSDAVDNYSAGASLSEMIKANPNLSFEDYMKEMAKYSDEWAEKLIDYYAEKASIDEQNRYTAEREDTAYQRLVDDLKKAGLNPAMMYGSTASTSASGSVGHIGMSEGATYKGVGSNYKMKSLLLALAALEWQINHESTQDKIAGLGLIAKVLVPVLGML